MSFEKNMGESSKKGKSPEEGFHYYVPSTISEILRRVSAINGSSEKSSELDLHIRSYDEELSKVSHFQRELPLCMKLLQEAIVRLEMEKTGLSKMPIEEKKIWMNSGELWSAPVEYEIGIDLQIKKSGGVRRGRASVTHKKSSRLSEQQREKKPRQFWGFHLHQKFVDALNTLGGAHAATPKRIRAVMQVEGLTNDQVKSHLQKYRIFLKKDSQMGINDGPPLNLDPQTRGFSTNSLANLGLDYDEVMQENEPVKSLLAHTSKGKRVDRSY